jgi:hypothetical protein
MLAVKRIVALITLVVVCFGLGLAGCGEGDGLGETVYVYVLNAYPGSSKLTLYGPTGKLASGLPFGQRTDEAVELNRNTNSDEFTLVLDGAPTEIIFTKQLFALYPQETATIVISRRSGEESASSSLFRHTRTVSPSCVLTFANSLAVANQFLPANSLSYSYQTEWKLESQDMYIPAAETHAQTRCGPTPIRDQDVAARQAIHDAIAEDPWFFPVVAEEQGLYQLVWGRRTMDPRTEELISNGLELNGQVMAVRPTVDYINCMSAAVTVKQDETATGTEDTAQQACPTDGEPLEVTWDELAVSQCFELTEYSGFPVVPGQDQATHSFSLNPRDVNGDLVCGFPVRIRTAIQDLIFKSDGATGELIEIDASFPASERHFFVLFGRPVNPFISQWNSEETSVRSEDGEFAYPGEIAPTYGQASN